MKESFGTLEGLNGALDDLSKRFSEDIDKRLGSEKSKSAVMSKFWTEGSLATLSSVEIQEDKAKLMSYGDSPIFYFDGETLHLKSALKGLADFRNNPYLINWNSEQLDKEGFSFESIEVKKGQRFVVCSDAFGQLILCLQMRYKGNEEERNKVLEIPTQLGVALGSVLNSEPIVPSKSKSSWKTLPKSDKELFDWVSNIAKNKKRFNKVCEFFYQEKMLLRDDYSLVVMF